MLNPYYCHYLVLREIHRTLRVNMAIRVIKTTIAKATIVRVIIIKATTTRGIIIKATTTRGIIIKATTTRGLIGKAITVRGIIYRANMLIQIIARATTIRIPLLVKAIQIKVTAVITNLYRFSCLPPAARISEPIVQSISNSTYELLSAAPIQSDTQSVWPQLLWTSYMII
jgi:hypothetical protein